MYILCKLYISNIDTLFFFGKRFVWVSSCHLCERSAATCDFLDCRADSANAIERTRTLRQEKRRYRKENTTPREWPVDNSRCVDRFLSRAVCRFLFFKPPLPNAKNYGYTLRQVHGNHRGAGLEARNPAVVHKPQPRTGHAASLILEPFMPFLVARLGGCKACRFAQAGSGLLT